MNIKVLEKIKLKSKKMIQKLQESLHCFHTEIFQNFPVTFSTLQTQVLVSGQQYVHW